MPSIRISQVAGLNNGYLAGSSTIWVDAVISAAKDPAALAANYSERLLSKIWQYTEHESISFRSAAYASLSTLAFVAPHAILPELQQRVLSGLNPSQLDFIGSAEIGIYNTPAGTTYVDGKCSYTLPLGT